MATTPTGPLALVVRTAGTNCDAEMARAFELAGAAVELIHVDQLVANPAEIDRFDLIGWPGGFSHGDDIGAGRVLAAKVREQLYPKLREAAQRGVAMIGVCNGFQVLVQTGLLPGPEADGSWAEAPAAPSIGLADNTSGRFIDTWVEVQAEVGSPCVWTKELEGSAFDLPIAHGEGRLVAQDQATLDALAAGGQLALRYTHDVNGSAGLVAGVCDASGRIFGLMPHPERFLGWHHHPNRARATEASDTPGLQMFKNAVEAVAATV